MDISSVANQQRSFAIDKLRRAASQRELRNRGMAVSPLSSSNELTDIPSPSRCPQTMPAQYASSRLQSSEVNRPDVLLHTPHGLSRSSSAAGRLFGPSTASNYDFNRLHMSKQIGIRTVANDGQASSISPTIQQNDFDPDDEPHSYDNDDDYELALDEFGKGEENKHGKGGVKVQQFQQPYSVTLRRKTSVTERTFCKSWIIKKVNSMLLVPSVERRRPLLDDPPRRYISETAMLQVINSNTITERHLFLFSDILISAKPLHGEAKNSLDASQYEFQIKNIIDLRKAALVVMHKEEEQKQDLVSPQKRTQNSVLTKFLDLFHNNADVAIQYLISKAILKNDPTAIAHVLFKTPEVDKTQLGKYLSDFDNEDVLVAFTDRFRFEGTRIDEALRIFLMSFRMPSDPATVEYMLESFATRWHAANQRKLQFDRKLTFKLVMCMLALNAALHNLTDGPLASIESRCEQTSRDGFLTYIHERDSDSLIGDELISKIYRSIRSEALETAIDNYGANEVHLECEFQPARPRTRLSLRVPSEDITIIIPNPDPNFCIKISGQDLRCDPSLLDFSQSNKQSFRVTGLALGRKSLMFIKSGTNAKLYDRLPSNKTFIIERSFMRHTFQLNCVNANGTSRKYMYSIDSAEALYECIRQFGHAIAISAKADKEDNSKQERAARAVALQVLRDAFMQDSNNRRERTSQQTPNVVSRDELIHKAIQNSLTPVVLGFLKSIVDADPDRRKP